MATTESSPPNGGVWRASARGWLALAAFTAACGSSSASTDAMGEFAPGAGAPSDGSSGGAAATPPAEREVESSYQSPVATGNYVWIANPTSGRVAYINAATLEVHTVEAGNGPTFVAAVPNQPDDTALVLNVLSDDATLLRATGGKVAATTFKTAHGGNAWALSSDGRWAIAWTDAKAIATAPKTEGYQDLTVIDLTGAIAPAILAVGYRPVTVGFASSSATAYAVTQDGVSIVDLFALGGPLVTKNVAISDNPLEDPGTRDVSVTPDGQLAFIRRDNKPDITAVSLDTGTRTTITLPGSVTDLDLADTGKLAVAVVRDQGLVAILPVPEIVTTPTSFTSVTVTGTTVGSVSLAPGGSIGLLYTNAIPVEQLTLLSIASTPAYRTVKLYSPVLAVFSSPDAQHAVVIHDKVGGPTPSPGAFSIVPIAANLPAKIVATQAAPTSVAISPSSDRAVVAERDDTKKIYGAYLARMPQLMVDRYPLASPPIAVGIVAGAKRAYVAQIHPDGRITFIDLTTGQARTLTGFELGARIVDGSTP